MPPILVIALYKFVDLPDFEEIKPSLLDFCKGQNIKGTILLAREGINGTIAGLPDNIRAVLEFIKQDSRFKDLEHKESYCEKIPFRGMKVRLKKEIVTLGAPEADPNKKVGIYVKPEDWNALISDPEVLLIDTRNEYEVELGTFKGAQNPHTKSFGQFPKHVGDNLDPARDKKVALFCTGGIRCEKASSYMLNHGFKEVYHLQGGILKYLEKVPAEESLWQGECFVFDGRVTVTHNLQQGTYRICGACRQTVSPEEMASPLYKKDVSCPHCHDKKTSKHKIIHSES